jgi:hypothetical protein
MQGNMDDYVPFGNVVGDIVPDSEGVVADDETCGNMSGITVKRRTRADA